MIKRSGIYTTMRRNPYQSSVAILIMTLTFFVTGTFLFLSVFSSGILSYFESKPQITIFFTDKKTKESIQILSENLKASGRVSATKYVSKEDALSIYKEQNKQDPLLLEMVTADILPASLEIQAKDPHLLSEIYNSVKNEPEIEEVVYQKDIVESLLSWTNTIRKGGVIIVSVLMIVSLMTLMTVIGMKIALKREEIDILKLVGATASYIKKPFIIEGFVYGVIGATISWVLLYLLILYSTPFLGSFLSGVTTLSVFTVQSFPITIWPVSITFMLLLLVVELVIGICIGVGGSLLALRRFLKY